MDNSVSWFYSYSWFIRGNKMNKLKDNSKEGINCGKTENWRCVDNFFFFGFFVESSIDTIFLRCQTLYS